MLHRCYGAASLTDKPSYADCEVGEDFLHFQVFAEWFYSQVIAADVDYQVDKDLLVKGNKVYSQSYCLLVPRAVNTFLCKSDSVRGDWPVGVSYNKRDRKFTAKVKFNGVNRNLGYFNDPVSAFNTYKLEKEKAAKLLAEQFSGKCDTRVIDSLLNYRVEITD